ncbi:uncharacterized protein LOC135703069 isoform X2 [Ochlerotatus camptorhynchus]|uniref:uncharacterized protein LOC135703069 isoform X2 n=1 Tax=Ochlerotatus camptorhynchus TaxID=644619 RepID=UPI0031DDE3D7
MSDAIEGRTEKLIKLVRQHPELYDPKHTKYYDTSYKNKVWNVIGAVMEEESLACKNRWANIRDQNLKNVNKRLSSQGTNIPKYKFSDELSFLTEYADATDEHQESQFPTLPPTFPPMTYPAEESLNLKEEPAQNLNHDDVFDECIIKDEPIEPELIASSSATTDHFEAPTDTYADVIGSPKNGIITRVNRPDWKRLSTEPATTEVSSSRMMEILLQELEVARHPDPVDAFLIGLAPALKNLHPHYWLQAKSEIFSIVQKYELQMLTELPPM